MFKFTTLVSNVQANNWLSCWKIVKWNMFSHEKNKVHLVRQMSELQMLQSSQVWTLETMSEVSYLSQGDEDLDCCPLVPSPSDPQTTPGTARLRHDHAAY